MARRVGSDIGTARVFTIRAETIRKGSKEGNTEVYHRVRPKEQPSVVCTGWVKKSNRKQRGRKTESIFFKGTPYNELILYNVWGR